MPRTFETSSRKAAGFSLPDDKTEKMGRAHGGRRDGSKQKIAPARIVRGNEGQVGNGLFGAAKDFAPRMPPA